MRPSRDEYGIAKALLAATRSTCLRRAVGAVAVNVRGHELATGYNGVPSGFPHCNEGHPCPGAGAASGTELDACLAVHAEVSMLSQCPDVWAIDTVYISCSPCFGCVKALLSSGCRRIVFAEAYPHPEAGALWRRAGREWVHLPTSEETAA